ncbi:probable cytochrome P450 6d4 [Phlebotomus argentipes]|uniref:probable cytochrome P450 6d4 n=1 Tax=Phlebotomus argentipes TaxID=94469 RepID=UPI0028932431|nr:probable cytochrome P450 6d4 [Phlebotomus argentipes]
MLSLPSILAFLCSVITFGFFYVRRSYSYWERRNVKGLKPSFPLGNFGPMMTKQSLGDFCDSVYKSVDAPMVGIYAITRPVLLIRDPELCRRILIKDFQFFHDRGIYHNAEADPLSAHLVSLDGVNWRNLRNKLSPAFTTGKLRGMFKSISASNANLEAFLSKEVDRGTEICMFDLMGRHMTNVIASTVLGFDVDCIANPDAPIREAGKRFFSPSAMNGFRLAMSFFLPTVSQWIRLKTTDSRYEEIMMTMVKQIVEDRERNNTENKDFMQLLMQLRNSDKSAKMSLGEVAAQVHLFYIAGYDTTALTIAYCLFELAKSVSLKTKVVQEIDDVLKRHDGQITYESVADMKFLDCCVYEVLRLYSLVIILKRECTRDYLIPGTDTVIEKGTPIMIPTVSIHHDPKHYPNPQKFQPERFESRTSSDQSGMYLPFGLGPKQCIAMNMGRVISKIGLVSILSNFDVHLGKDLARNSHLHFIPNSIMRIPVGGLKLKISRRKNE